MSENENLSSKGGKSSVEKRDDSDKASAAAIEKYLKGIHFPAKSQDLIKHAEGNHAPQNVLNVLGRFDKNREFHTAADVAKEIGRVEG